MNKYPEKDWRNMIRELVVAPAENRAEILRQALKSMSNEEDRVMALVDLQKIFGGDSSDL